MRVIKIISVIIAFTVLMYVELTSGDMPQPLHTAYVPDVKYRKDNSAEFIAGCQTHHPPVPPKNIYPTVSKNFVTLLCALEVPPPQGALLLQRNALDKPDEK